MQVIGSKEKAESRASSWKGEVPVVGSVVAKVFKSQAMGTLLPRALLAGLVPNIFWAG